MRAVRITTKDGERRRLGCQHETSEDLAFPTLEIAKLVAQRAGVTVKKRAGVRVGSQYWPLLTGVPAWDHGEDIDASRGITEADMKRLVAANHRLMFVLAFLRLGLAGIALLVDLGRAAYLNGLSAGAG